MERDSARRFRGARIQQAESAPRRIQSESCAGSAMGSGVVALLGGAAVGAIAMYLMDPNHGAERRTQAVNLAERAMESAGDVVHSASHVVGSAMHAAKEKLADTASSAFEAMPDTHRMKKKGAKLMGSACDTASSAADTARSWLQSAKDHLPSRARLERHSDYAMNPAAVSATAFSTLLIGAGAMWLFDPAKGRARRAWIGQKMTRYLNDAGGLAGATGRHLRNKMTGQYYKTRSAIQHVASSATG